MSTSASTVSPRGSAERANDAAPPSPSGDTSVSTRLLDSEPEPFPYTRVRDWIALQPQSVLGDGAFRLYYVSRSVIFENSKGGAPSRPVIEITYVEYAAIMGRNVRTIQRFADELYKVGLWEVLERTSRSVVIPDKPRPQVRTVLTIRVHDYPREPWSYDGPVKTWDVLAAIRAANEPAPAQGDIRPGQAATTGMSGQKGGISGQRPPDPDDSQADPDTITADQSATTTASGQSDQAKPEPDDDDQASAEHPTPGLPVEVPITAGQCATTSTSQPTTNLSDHVDISAGQTACEASLKNLEKEPPSLPPAPQAAAASQAQELTDELAMFSPAAVELVTELYEQALQLPAAQPLSAEERAGLARRIDQRTREGWSLTRVRAVLLGGRLDSVNMPGRLWSKRLDDMPAVPAGAMPAQGPPRPASATPAAEAAVRRQSSSRQAPQRRSSNDCSQLPDPNAGMTRFEVPDNRGMRLVARWMPATEAPPWCSRCDSDSRTLRPAHSGELPQPCPHCHPAPEAFPPVPPSPRPAPALTGADAG